MTDHAGNFLAGAMMEGPPDLFPAPTGCAPTYPGLSLPDLAEWLPRLGPVLWLERLGRQIPAAIPPRLPQRGVVLGCLAGRLLADGARLSVHAAVTPRGPREWMCLRGGGDELRGKLFLLPDSDFLAWDEMSEALGLVQDDVPVARWRTHVAFLSAVLARIGTSWRARILCFECGRASWVRMLDAMPPLRLSLVGMELARSIAREGGAELAGP